MVTYQTPGVYKEEVFPAPAPELRTGVPALLGFAKQGPVNQPQMLTLWPQFEQRFGAPLTNGYLYYAVRGFFENGGLLCYVVRLTDNVGAVEALRNGLEALAPLNAVDLICAPDIMRPRQQGLDTNEWLSPSPDEVQSMQTAVLDHCTTLGDRFAILDALPCAGIDGVMKQRQTLNALNGAFYYPWLQLANGPVQPPEIEIRDCPLLVQGFVPPCGHVAGIYARSDQRVGVYKAPANETVEGVLDLEINLSNVQQGLLNPEGINCLRAFPGRGIRVWGARTLSREAVWTYVNVRRLFLTAGRWIERNMTGVVFEPHDIRLWARISRELTAYFNDLFQRGALKGSTAQEAFYIKCNAETNPPEVRNAGQIVTEIGLAPAVPSEFVIVRIIHGSNGVTITST
jgi:phage tail sheath protein FI